MNHYILAKTRSNRNKLKSVRGFIILRPGDGLSSFSKDNSANFLVKKKCNEVFRGVYNLRIRPREKTSSQISYSQSFSSKNLKVSITFTQYWTAFTPVRRPYQVWLLFTQVNGDFGAISVTARSYAAPILKVDCHISDTFLPLFFRVNRDFDPSGSKWAAARLKQILRSENFFSVNCSGSFLARRLVCVNDNRPFGPTLL